MPDNSFDIVSKIELPEVVNAIQQAMKEIITRYDLKDSHSNIELNEKDQKITLHEGDCVYFDSSLKHRLLSGEDEVKVLAVVTR